MTGRGSKVARAAVVVALVGAAAGWQTFAAFSSTTSNAGNSFSAGTVYVADNDNGCAIYQAPAPSSGACHGVTLDAANQKPGGAVQGCYQVTYTGTLPADLKMYWTPAGAGDTLSSKLHLTVTRGTQATPAFPSCAGFTPAATSPVVYDGTLGAFNTSTSPISAGFPDGQTSWNTSNAQVYQLTVTLTDDGTNAANGASAGPMTTGSHDFTWLATNQ